MLNGNPFGHTIRVIPDDSALLACYTAVVASYDTPPFGCGHTKGRCAYACSTLARSWHYPHKYACPGKFWFLYPARWPERCERGQRWSTADCLPDCTPCRHDLQHVGKSLVCANPYIAKQLVALGLRPAQYRCDSTHRRSYRRGRQLHLACFWYHVTTQDGVRTANVGRRLTQGRWSASLREQ
jgi:hypothetical protein